MKKIINEIALWLACGVVYIIIIATFDVIGRRDIFSSLAEYALYVIITLKFNRWITDDDE